jgi:hypothetical protein
MDIDEFRDMFCKKDNICWQIEFAKGLDLSDYSMLKVCAKCIYFKGEEGKECQ